MPDHTRWSGIIQNLLPADDVINASWRHLTEMSDYQRNFSHISHDEVVSESQLLFNEIYSSLFTKLVAK